MASRMFSDDTPLPAIDKNRKGLSKNRKSISFATEKVEISIPVLSDSEEEQLNPSPRIMQKKAPPQLPEDEQLNPKPSRIQRGRDEFSPKEVGRMKKEENENAPEVKSSPPLKRKSSRKEAKLEKIVPTVSAESTESDHFHYDDQDLKRFQSMHEGIIDVGAYAGYFCQNIDKFFKYNKNNLVRPKLKVDELEQKKARSWVFFLIVIQIVICTTYTVLVMKLPKFWVNCAFALALGLYFGLKIFAVLLFILRRGRKNWKCCSRIYDAEQNKKAKEIFICIPAYNEEKSAFENTVSSILATNYPKEKMYMFFIVDGNKGNTYQNLMELLLDKPCTETVVPGKRVLKHGLYHGIPYSVFLKEENRGKRDSQWLFVELLRNMIPEYAPSYVFFVDSDTSFEPDSIRYMAEALDEDEDEKVAGVCGKLTLSNFGLIDRKSFDNTLYYLSTIFIVGFQFYEYHFNQIIGKQAEAAFDSVSCLPGAFSMFRANLLTTVEARIGKKENLELLPSVMMKDMTSFSLYYYQNKQQLPLILDDFFSKPTVGIIDRNLYELGEDRTLTVRLLEQGYKCKYEPRAVAQTECPDSIVRFFQQRRRWNNSTFVNLAAMLTRGSLWRQAKTFPIMIFTLFDLIGSYLSPANAVILMWIIWTPLFRWISIQANYEILGLPFIIWFIGLQLMMISVTNADNTGGMLYVLITFFSGLLMAASAYFFVFDFVKPIVDRFVDDPAPMENWVPIVMVFIFPLLHLIMTISMPPALLTVVFYYLMIPVISLTLPFYSFLHLDDFSWGNR